MKTQHEPPIVEGGPPTEPPPKPADAHRAMPAQSLERIADALEKLSSDPEVAVDLGPPVCPFCKKFNPVISTPEEGQQEGPMIEWVQPCECKSCGGAFFMMPESYMVFTYPKEVKEEIERRKGGNTA